MAYYTESASHGLQDPSYNHPESYMASGMQPSYGIDSTIFSDPGPFPTRTSGPARASTSYAQQHTNPPSQRMRQVSRPRREPVGEDTLNVSSTSTTAEGFPLVDGDFAVSPFPVKSLTRDGRLKTKLMGIGHDGGFLTSPIIVGPPRTDSRTGRLARHEISIDSPMPQQHTPSEGIPVLPLQRSFRARSASVSSEMAPSLSMGTTASSTGFTSGAMSSSTSMSAHHSRDGGKLAYDDNSLLGQMDLTGLGVDLSHVPALDDNTLDLFGPDLCANPNLNLSQPGFEGFIDLPLPPPPRQSNSLQNETDIRLTQSGRLVFADELDAGGLAQQRPQRGQQQSQRPVKAMPSRSLNKAKSCSALSPSAREMAAQSPYYDEPLTPVSAHNSPYDTSFASSNGASTNSAGTAPAPAIPEVPPHLLSFADLYHYGLVQEAALANSIRKSPLNQMSADFGGIGLGMSGSATGNGNRLYAAGNGLVSSLGSSPATPYGTDGSADPASHYRTPEEPSSAIMYARPSTGSSRSSFSHGAGPTPVNFSRPRMPSQSYAQAEPLQPSPYAAGHFDDSANGRRPSRQSRAPRQPAESSIYGNSARNFSYPTRFAAAQHSEQYDQRAQVPPPLPPQSRMEPATPQFAPPRPASNEVQWAHPPPQIPLPPVPTTPQRRRINPHARCLTGPAGSMADYPLDNPDAHYGDEMIDEYERQLATYDSLYQPMQLPVPPPPPAAAGGKRTREQDDGPVYGTAPSPGTEDQRPKRLRSVASAPCLPSRRLKPGPKPKTMKTPEQEHQSVFNATLSPPVPQIHRGASPFSSPLLSDDDSEFPALDANGQIATTSTITYVPGPPALPGQPRSSVPREVIQSLYSHTPSHMSASGVKVPKRYMCLIEGCERSFPRKSAIESHIQTHLEDKPFICPHDDCDASFVRQHDLKRHERIHSGNKPFPCPCGKGFARGDALARHRARGICCGALAPRQE
ncbi:hypothetical protein JCM10908_001237 [Rhodotorula pacifica]|uniref:uncharacterized protein n=1 Tax=Rhodotorula pacifica TaxID=1495444 RepID=UPI003173F57A